MVVWFVEYLDEYWVGELCDGVGDYFLCNIWYNRELEGEYNPYGGIDVKRC